LTPDDRPTIAATIAAVLAALPWQVGYVWAAYAWLPLCGWLMARPWLPWAVAVVVVVWWRLWT
jgi:hypothetical protein